MIGTARTGSSIITTRKRGFPHHYVHVHLLKVTIDCLVYKMSENTENAHHNFPEAKTTS